MFSPRPWFATLSRSRIPRNPDSRPSSGVISGNPIGSIESISISPSSMRYRRPHPAAGPRPDSDTASNFPATYSLAKSFSERHEESLESDISGDYVLRLCGRQSQQKHRRTLRLASRVLAAERLELVPARQSASQRNEPERAPKWSLPYRGRIPSMVPDEQAHGQKRCNSCMVAATRGRIGGTARGARLGAHGKSPGQKLSRLRRPP